MKWVARILWFAGGALTCVLWSFGHTIYKNFTDETITISVANSTPQPLDVQIVGSQHTIDIGDIRRGREVTREITISDLGEGSASIRVDNAVPAEYSLGIFLIGKGPFERYIRLTPTGPVAFFYSPSHPGGWCGILEKEDRNATSAK